LAQPSFWQEYGHWQVCGSVVAVAGAAVSPAAGSVAGSVISNDMAVCLLDWL
jgi:hypothetical protein